MRLRSFPWLRMVTLLVWLGVFGLTTVQAAQAQSRDIRFDPLTIEDGLSQNTVHAIWQDTQGFLWFGTEDGLNLYDGYTFTIYKHDPDNPATLSNSSVRAFFEDRQGRFWVGTAQGLNRFERQQDTFTHYLDAPTDPNSLSGQTVTAIAQTADGQVWVATSEGGLNRLNADGVNFTHLRHDPHRSDSLASDTVTALAADELGGLWVGTADGLDYYDPQGDQFIHYKYNPQNSGSLSDNQILSLFIDHQKTLWVGTEEGGLNRLNVPEQNFTRFTHQAADPRTLAGNDVRTIYEDKRGRLWVGGRSGLHLYDRSQNSFSRLQHNPENAHSISNDSILSMLEDRSGIVWVGTQSGGLSKYNQTNDRFLLYQHQPGNPNSLSNNVVNAIWEDHTGAVWIGTTDGGLNRLNRADQTFKKYVNDPLNFNSLGSNDVRAVYEDHNQVLWAGTNGGGLNRFDPTSEQFKRYWFDPTLPNSLSDSRVTALLEDSARNFWVGTRDGGLNLMDRATGSFRWFQADPNNPSSLSGNYIRALYEDHFGSLWVGTNSGITVMDIHTYGLQRYLNNPQNIDSLNDDHVLSFYESSDGAMWIGTLLGGLNRFDHASQTFKHYDEKKGLPNDTIYAILPGKDGSLWLSTNKGISHFDPDSETFRNYDMRDGLQSNEFSPGAAFENSAGWVYLGGVQGFNLFDPTTLQDNQAPPPVVITAFKKFNQTVRTNLTDGEEITLSYQDNFISFDFAALDYNTPSENEYAYRLDGFDKDWVSAGTRRNAIYTNLKGGNYVFRVKGANKYGIWNQTGTSVRIRVIPPIWEEWWFIGLIVLGISGSGVGIFWLRIKQVQRQQRRLEVQVSERTAEIVHSAGELERRREVAEGLREILSILNSNLSLKECLDYIIQQAHRLMGVDEVVIFRCGEGGHCVVITSTFTGSFTSQAIQPWISAPLLSGQSFVAQNLAQQRKKNPEMQADLTDFGAVLAVPFMATEIVDGGLVLLYRRPHPFSEEDLQTARSFADHAALAIANARLRSQAEEMAVSAERSRLARELHDAVTQTLFATSLIADVLPRLWERNPQAGREKLEEIRELTRGALAEMRNLLMELRPTALDNIPLPDLLRQLADAFTGRARVPVRLKVDRTLELPSPIKIGFYRIAQEALNNVQKHARASEVEISLFLHNGIVQMIVADNGAGFNPQTIPSGRFGLGIMQERAETIGATYRIETTPGKGTRILLFWEQNNENPNR